MGELYTPIILNYTFIIIRISFIVFLDYYFMAFKNETDSN